MYINRIIPRTTCDRTSANNCKRPAENAQGDGTILFVRCFVFPYWNFIGVLREG